MRKKAIIDEDLPRALGEELQKMGWQVIDVRDTDFRGEPDSKIMRLAHMSKAVLFSGDWGFANILRFPPIEHHGIVIIAFPSEVSVNFVVRETRRILKKIPVSKICGNLLIVEPGRARLRHGA